MICDKLDNLGRYVGLSSGLDAAIRALEAGAYRDATDGRYALDGENVYYVVQSPVYVQEGRWERHRDYLDIQLSLTGDERCGYLPADEVRNWSAYDAEKDIFFSDDAQPGLSLPLKKGWFVLFFPQDAHRPCLAASGEATGRKVVFKVRV